MSIWTLLVMTVVLGVILFAAQFGLLPRKLALGMFIGELFLFVFLLGMLAEYATRYVY